MAELDIKTEDYGWIDREQTKCRNNPLVWERETFWRNRHARYRSTPELQIHFAHVSENDKAMLAYTPSLEYGRANRQVKLKPGRYLSKFFPELTPKQVQFYAQWFAQGVKPEGCDAFAGAVLCFATTPDDIVDVYMKGPSSCMDRRHFHDAEDNPTRAYGAGDLAVAYLKMPGTDRIIARSLVWPDKKVAGRIYPTAYAWRDDRFDSEEQSEDVRTKLLGILKKEGYKHVQEGGDFEGAKLLKIECDKYDTHGYLMPYIDGDWGVNAEGDHFVMSKRASYGAQSTSGVIIADRKQVARCGQCHARYDEDDGRIVYLGWHGRPYRSIRVCPACFAAARYCQGSGETYVASVAMVELAGRRGLYCQAWAENAGFMRSDLTGHWIARQSLRRLPDGTSCSRDEYNEYIRAIEAGLVDGHQDSGTVDAREQEEMCL